MLFPLLAMSTASTDEDLVRLCVAGDRNAFSRIVRKYEHRVFSICLRWLGEPALAEELAQDIFIALFRSLAGFRGDCALSTWIYKITINHCKNARLYRKRRAWDRHEPIEGNRRDDERPRELPSGTPGSDAGAIRTDAERLIALGLAGLSEEHRQIIILRDIEDLDYEEIAEILDVPRGTVKSRLHRARADLASVLRNHLSPESVKP
jgi:RNA polymerase sigma-70 factor (ECF subfamily)